MLVNDSAIVTRCISLEANKLVLYVDTVRLKSNIMRELDPSDILLCIDLNLHRQNTTAEGDTFDEHNPYLVPGII